MAGIAELARDRLGFEGLRPGQERAVQALADGRDALAVLPTGGGKSAIYELAGMLREGPTVVVSPLIALQDDQLAHLHAVGLQAVVLNSQQSAGAHVAALLASCDSSTFIFLSPEQLANEQTRQTLRRAAPGLFAVDEAHLISQWGHDFRPDYMLLGAQAEAVGAPVRLALTATAAPPVRSEIVRRLGLRDPVAVIGDFDRPHIQLSVRRVRTMPDKQQELLRAVAELTGPGIVYAATHADAQAAHDTLAAAHERVTLYHAGLSARERREAMTAALVRLADLGAAAWQADGEIRWTGAMTVAAALAASEAETQREDEVERTRLTMMRRYAEHTGCRRSFLLTYFGQDYPGPCGNCDNDLAPAQPAAGAVPFAVGTRVASERWGEGTVQRYDGDHVTVLFDQHGYRELFVPVVVERALLRPA